MKMTKQFKDWLVENCGIKADASEEDFQKGALKAIGEGTLSPTKLAELTEEKTNDAPPQKSAEDLIAEAVGAAVGPIAEQVSRLAESVAKQGDKEGKGNDDDADGKDHGDLVSKIADEVAERLAGEKSLIGPSPAGMFRGTSDHSALVDKSRADIRMKKPVERYNQTTTAAIYGAKSARAGMPATFMGRGLDVPSEADLAVSGAYFKYCVQQSAGGSQVPRGLRMTEHDKQLMEYAIHEEKWTGMLKGVGMHGEIKVDNRKLSNLEIKALIDDSVSGGLEAAPIVFDDAVISTPVLHGELFPKVSVTPISRGRRIEAFSIGNPTFSAVPEGTAVTPFDTTSFIAAFDNTVFNAVGAMEIGLDFEDDSPVNMGALVVQRYGEKAMEWLDEQIAIGDGTTEPQGVFNASGITDIGNPAGGAGAAAQIDDYEALLFGLAKQFRPAADKNRACFISNDTTYRRARAIAVGSSDARRVFGMDHESYRLLDHPHSIQNSIGNASCGFFNLKHYRMYRRLGMQVRVESGGKELATKNLLLVIVRMRWAGRLEQGGAGAFSDNWEA